MKRLLLLVLSMLAITACQGNKSEAEIPVDGGGVAADRFINYYLDEYNDEFSTSATISKSLDKYVIQLSLGKYEHWISYSSDEYEAIAETCGDVAIEDHYTWIDAMPPVVAKREATSIDIKCANGAVYSSNHTSGELLNGDAIINYMPLTDVIKDQVETIYYAYEGGYDKTTTVEEYNAAAVELLYNNITITLPETDAEGLTFDITLTSNGKSIPVSITYNY